MASAYPTFPGDDGAITKFQILPTGGLDDAAVGFANLRLVWVFPVTVAVLSGGLLLVRSYADVVLIVANPPVVGIGF